MMILLQFFFVLQLILKDASNPNTIYTSSDAGKTFTQKNLHFLPSILRYSRVAARSGSIAGYDSSTKIVCICCIYLCIMHLQ